MGISHLSIVFPPRGVIRPNLVLMMLVLLIGGNKISLAGALIPPPHMPPVFNKKVVAYLIADIDKNRSDVVLRVGYFGRRRKPLLPFEDGLQLVKIALAREKAGSRRWLLLESVYAFGAFSISASDQISSCSELD